MKMLYRLAMLPRASHYVGTVPFYEKYRAPSLLSPAPHRHAANKILSIYYFIKTRYLLPLILLACFQFQHFTPLPTNTAHKSFYFVQ